MPRLSRLAALFLAGASVSGVNAQVVFDKVRVNEQQGSSPIFFGETAIALSRTNQNEFIAGVLCGQAPSCNIHYAIATSINSNGTPNIVTRGVLPRPTCCPGSNGVDPFVVSAADGRMFIGGQNEDPSLGGGFYVARTPSGGATLDASLAAVCIGGFRLDKPLAAIGPISSNDPAERFFLAFSRQADVFRLTERRWNMVPGSPECSASWTEPILAINPPNLQVPDDGFPGLGGTPVILRNTVGAPQRVGRIVVASGPAGAFGQLPFVMYLNASDTTWTPLGSTIPLLLFNNGGSQSPIFPIDRTQHIPGQIRVTNHPSVAFNPANGNNLYVAFAGRPTSTTGNVDLFIAWSRDGGATFDPLDTLRLTDDHHFLPNDPQAGSDEFQPSIGVDQWGGLHILYYSSTSPDTSTVQTALFTVRYAYIQYFAGQLTQNPSVRVLSPAFSFDVDPFPNITQPGLDYQQLSVSNCVTAVCYITTEEGTFNAYVRRIVNTACIIDYDGNGTIDSGDAFAFNENYAAGSSGADINGDGETAPPDWVQYMAQWAAACAGGCP
ncbi:MAG: hypothetical protein ACKVW3_00895 [Phycisphaerales bacterium]